MVTKNLGDDRLAENAAELHAVVEGHTPKSEESLIVFVLVELDQEAPLVLLCWRGRAIPFEADRDVLNGMIAPFEGRSHIDSLRQRGFHPLQVFLRDVQGHRLNFVGAVEICDVGLSRFARCCVRVLRERDLVGEHRQRDRKNRAEAPTGSAFSDGHDHGKVQAVAMSHANRPAMGCPFSSMGVGRPAGLVYCRSSGMPRNWNNVASRSFGETGFDLGTSPIAVDSP